MTIATDASAAAPIAAPSPMLVTVMVRSMQRASLAQALSDIAAQDHDRVEVVVVNAAGGHHADPGASCGRFPLRLVNQDGPPQQRAAAANLALAHARGDAWLFFDDDDRIDPPHLGRLVAALQADPAAVAAYADVDQGRDTAQGWRSLHRFAADHDPIRLRFENYLPIHAVLFRGQAVRAAGCRFDEQFALFEDWDFWLQLAQCGCFVHVPGVSARYAVAAAHGGSGVFDDSPATQAARERLFAKWQRRASADDNAALLRYVQALFRSAAANGERSAALARDLTEAQRMRADLQALVEARDSEIAAYARLSTDLRAEAQAARSGMQSIIDARDREIADYAAQLADLRAVVAAREAEIAGLSSRLAGLEAEGPWQALVRTTRRKRLG